MYLCAVLTERILGGLTTYKLALKGMPAGNQQFSYLVDTEFFSKMESADIHAGNVSVELNVKHEGDIFDLSFLMNGEIIISCDRCLDDMPLNVDTDYHLVVKYGEDYNDESDETLIIPESFNDLDLSSIIYDTIALTIPLKHIHPEGECNAEMTAQLNRHMASISDSEPDSEEVKTDPRWDALRSLLDNK